MTLTISLTHIVGRVKRTPIGEPKTSFYNIQLWHFILRPTFGFLTSKFLKICQRLTFELQAKLSLTIVISIIVLHWNRVYLGKYGMKFSYVLFF